MKQLKKHPVVTFISLIAILIGAFLLFKERNVCDQKFLDLDGKATEILVEVQKTSVDCEVDEDVMGWPSLSLKLERGGDRKVYKYLIGKKDTLFFLFAEFPESGRIFEEELSKEQKEEIRSKTLICLDELFQPIFPNHPPLTWAKIVFPISEKDNQAK